LKFSILVDLKIIRSQIGDLTSLFIQDDRIQPYLLDSNSDGEHVRIWAGMVTGRL